MRRSDMRRCCRCQRANNPSHLCMRMAPIGRPCPRRTPTLSPRVRRYVGAINDGALPTIGSAWQSVLTLEGSDVHLTKGEVGRDDDGDRLCALCEAEGADGLVEILGLRPQRDDTSRRLSTSATSQLEE